MGLSMRRDKWANPIRFDNLDPLTSVFGRTQCCKLTTGLSPTGATGQTAINHWNYPQIAFNSGRIRDLSVYLPISALRHTVRS
jgi:hypothetical protein